MFELIKRTWIKRIKSRRYKTPKSVVFTDIINSTLQQDVSQLTPKQRTAVRFKHRLWPGAVVPFTFAQNLESLVDAKKIIKEAMVEWERNTCIRFVERTDQPDYVEFAVNRGCNADVGRRRDKQIVSLGNGCLHKSVVIHEIGHVIGFWHVQNRDDRDEYVNIYTENIIDQYKQAFEKFNPYRIDSLGVDYDYHSIMHYGMRAFSKNGLYTILPKKKGIFTLGNNQLSKLDIKHTNLLYRCDSRNEDWTSWGIWTLCDKTCGGGRQERRRVCTSLRNHKQQCQGAAKMERACNLKKCPDWPRFPLDFSFENFRRQIGDESECILTYERADYEEWSSYSFCIAQGRRAIKMKWSDRGVIDNMKCTHIFEPEENHRNRWYDNYLCIPNDAPYNFTWSYNGRLENLACIQWYAKSGVDGWDNNYLCAEGPGTVPGFLGSAGEWSSWSEWSRCNKECGGGRQMKHRFCTNHRGGTPCMGKGRKFRNCNEQPCRQATCGGRLTATKGTITSPNYPSSYPSDINCTWIIEGAKTKHILFTIKSFDLEKIFDGPCTFDYLHIRDKDYNGTELGKFCGSTKPLPLVSLSNALWISMVTDGEDNRAGFRASWELQDAQPEGCGGLMTGISGGFHSPNFPLDYPPDKTCIWKIEAPKNYYIEIKFLSFHLEKNAICKYDSVVVHDGWNRTSPLLGRYCDIDPVKGYLKTRGNKALVKFVSDHSTEKSGFKLHWAAYKREIDNIIPEVDNELEDKKPSCLDNWIYFEGTIEGPACYLVKRNYFNWYGARDDCLQNFADLVSITTLPEQEFITKDLLQGNYMWLGISDEGDEGNWAWSDNTTHTTYRNWDHGDPNNGGRLMNEDCALIKPDGKWNDYPCEDRFNYICKRKPMEPWNVNLGNSSPPKRRLHKRSP